MRNTIFGAIGVLWGGGILIWFILNHVRFAEGVYGIGQFAGLIFGILLLCGGVSALTRAYDAVVRHENLERDSTGSPDE